MPPKKRKRAPLPPTECHWCGQDMSLPADYIDWEEVWRDRAIRQQEAELGRSLTDKEREEVDSGSDPCDDCCCGGCGSRKPAPGVVCC